MSIKRYWLMDNSREMEAHVDGEWVRYSDLVKKAKSIVAANACWGSPAIERFIRDLAGVTSRLSPCPFCGEPPNDESPFELCEDVWAVECQHCFSQGPQAVSATDAIHSWNKRCEGKK